MRRRLFLTGPIGCGKSTILLQALGTDRLHRAGGFLTVRRRRNDGSPMDFVLMDPAGREKQVFLDLTCAKPCLDMGVFSGLGATLLNQATEAPFVVLDEIGGMEVHCPEFMAALIRLLDSGVPIIGVLKSSESASKMEKTLGGEDLHLNESQMMQEIMCTYPDIHIESCVPCAKAAIQLAKKWVEEYVHD